MSGQVARRSASWARWLSADRGQIGDANTYSHNGNLVQLRRWNGFSWSLCSEDSQHVFYRITTHTYAPNGTCSSSGGFRSFGQLTVWISGQQYTNWCGQCYPLVSPQLNV